MKMSLLRFSYQKSKHRKKSEQVNVPEFKDEETHCYYGPETMCTSHQSNLNDSYFGYRKPGFLVTF